MSEEFDRVKTNDMALAAYLRMKGHTPTEVKWDAPVNMAYWLFDEAAAHDASQFLEDAVLVNPRDFSQAYGWAKRDLGRARSSATIR